MTFFDPRRIFENLYGGSPFNIEDIHNQLEDAGLKLPVNIIVVELEKHSLKMLTFNFRKLKVWIIDSDRNMLYITYNGSPEDMKLICDKQALLHGDSFHCNNAEQWMFVLRKAIISTRHRYLTRVWSDNHKHFSWADEREQLSIAVEAFQRERNWLKNVDLWLKIVLMRHKHTINDCRRKIMFFLTFSTANIDISTNFSFVFRQAIKQLENTYAFSDLQQVVIRILKEIHPYAITKETQQHIFQGNSYPEPVEKALTYMRKFYIKSITRKNVSTACFISPEYLSRMFKNETGYTITEYLQVLRVDHSRQLLIESNKGILSIAIESGFNSITHFHRVFKKQTKMSPHRYRREHSLNITT